MIFDIYISFRMCISIILIKYTYNDVIRTLHLEVNLFLKSIIFFYRLTTWTYWKNISGKHEADRYRNLNCSTNWDKTSSNILNYSDRYPCLDSKVFVRKFSLKNHAQPVFCDTGSQTKNRFMCAIKFVRLNKTIYIFCN